MRWLNLHCQLLSLALAGLAVLAEDRPCTVTDAANNRLYDLSPLMRTTGEDYVAKDEATGNIYKINVCNKILSETWKVSAPNTDIGIYRQNQDGGQSLGQFTMKPHISHDVLSLAYLEGSRCPSEPSVQMGSAIAFVCDHSVYGPGKPEFVAAVNDCSFFFTWRTQHACSTTSRSVTSGLGVILSGLILILLLYFGGFLAYNRFILKKTGRDQLPPLGPSMLEAWIFVKDMLVIVAVSGYDKVQSLLGRSSGRFQGLPG